MTTLVTNLNPAITKAEKPNKDESAKTSAWQKTTEYMTTASGMKKILLEPIKLALDWIDWGAAHSMKKAEPLCQLTGNTRTFLTLANLPKEVTRAFANYKNIPSGAGITTSNRTHAITKVAIEGMYAADSVSTIVEWGSKSSFLSLSRIGKQVCKAIGSLATGASIVENVLDIYRESKNPVEKQKSTLTALKVTKAAFSLLLGVTELASILSGSVVLLLLATVKVGFGIGIHFYEMESVAVLKN